MGFRDQAAAIPRVWSTATFPIPPSPAHPYRLLATPVAAESTGVVVKILLRIVCRPDPPLDVTTGKNRKPPGNRRKNSSGSDLFSPPLFCLSPSPPLPSIPTSPRPRAPFGSAILSADDDIAAGLVRFGGFRLVLKFYGLSEDTKDVLYIVSSFTSSATRCYVNIPMSPRHLR